MRTVLLAVLAISSFATELPTIAVTGGQIRGGALEKGGTLSGAVFKGIPYAQAPTGDLRWREPSAVKAWTGVREWGTGQAVQLRVEMERLAWRAKGKNWPEYSELDCFACHHSLTAPEQSWRQERGYAGRRPGDPPWNGSRYAVFRELAHQVDNDAATRLDEQIAQLAKSLSQSNPDRDAVAAASASASTLANQIAARIEAQPYDAALTLKLLQKISSDADEISNEGERAAEQAAMALDSLFIAYSRSEKPANAADVRAAINGLFQQLENPSNYNPVDFSRQMRKVGSLLR